MILACSVILLYNLDREFENFLPFFENPIKKLDQ